jgi:CxxC-x17-CxxC domain-containing protein
MSDQEITCAECGSPFLFREAEQQFYAERGLAAPPKRCKPCRQARKAQAEGAGGGGRDARPEQRGGDRGAPRFNDRGAPGGKGPNGRPAFRSASGGFGAPPRAGFGNGPRQGSFNGPARGDAGGFNGGGPRGERGGFNGPSRGDAGGFQGAAPRSDGAGFAAPRGDRGGFGAPRGEREPRPNRFNGPSRDAAAPRASAWGTRPTDGGHRPPRAPRRDDDRARATAADTATEAPPERLSPRGRPERPKFDITCAECGTQSKVPFKPLEGRQVFCQPCYKARKGTTEAAEGEATGENNSGIVE